MAPGHWPCLRGQCQRALVHYPCVPGLLEHTPLHLPVRGGGGCVMCGGGGVCDVWRGGGWLQHNYVLYK